jgi:Bacterial membrane protein YfhO
MYPTRGIASLSPLMRLSVPAGLKTWARTHPRLVALILFTILAVIYFGPGLLPGHTTSASDYLWSVAPWNTQAPSGLFVWSTHPFEVGSNTQLVDPTTVFEPYLQYTRSQLPHIPLWDPYIMGGTPFLGDMQSAIFSPFSIPAYILPFWWSLSVIAVLKVVVAAMGAFLLGRALKMRFAGAFLCGTVFGFGLFLIAWLPWPLANVFPWIPWMLLATEYLIRRPGLLTASGLAFIVALQFFGGHPESSFQALFAVGCYFVLRVLQSPGGAVAAVRTAAAERRSRLGTLYRSVRKPILVFVVAIALGAALAAVAIVPFVELLRKSSDLSSRPRGLVHVQPKFFFASLVPDYFDRVPTNFLIEDAFYAGALPVMLALIALMKAKVERIAIAIFAALCIVVVLGIQPLFGFVGRLPGFDETYLSRLTILYLLCMALLAGWGLDDLMAHRPTGRRAVVAGSIAGGLFVLPIVIVLATRGTSLHFFARAAHIAWGFAQEPLYNSLNWEPVIRLAAILIWVTVAGFAVILLYLRIGRGIAPVLFAVLAILLVVGDLFQAGFGENPGIPDSHAVQPITPAIRYLESQSPARYVAVDPYVGFNPLPPDVNIDYGLYDARGYDLPVIDRFSELWSRYVAPATPLLPLDTPAVPILEIQLQPSGPPAMRVLSLLGVRDLLEQKGESPLQMPGLHLVYDGADATIYQNDNALPRTWLVADQDVIKSDTAELTAVASTGFNPRSEVITGSDIPGIPENDPDATSPGTAEIADYQAQQVTIDADPSRAAELVLSDTYYPGWSATVNGRPVDIHEVDYLLRGVSVPPGNDRIVFTYNPSSFREGWITSLASTVVLVAATVVGLRRRRRHAHVRGRKRDVPDSTQSGTASGEEVLSKSPFVHPLKT